MVETKLAHHLSLYNSFSHKRMLLKEQKEKSNGVKEVCRGNFTRIYLYKEDRPTQLLCLSNAEWCKTYGRKIVWCTAFLAKIARCTGFSPKSTRLSQTGVGSGGGQGRVGGWGLLPTTHWGLYYNVYQCLNTMSGTSREYYKKMSKDRILTFNLHSALLRLVPTTHCITTHTSIHRVGGFLYSFSEAPIAE